MPDFTTFSVMALLDMFIDGQQAFGVRSLVWLFGAFAHGHYLATGWKVWTGVWDDGSATNDAALYQNRPPKRKNAA
ncbi:hypothetical protein D3C81_2095560 [compost metagenome]